MRVSQVLESVEWDKLAERRVVFNWNRSLILPTTRAPAHQPNSASIGGPALVAVGTLGARFHNQSSRDVCTSLSHPTTGLRHRLGGDVCREWRAVMTAACKPTPSHFLKKARLSRIIPMTLSTGVLAFLESLVACVLDCPEWRRQGSQMTVGIVRPNVSDLLFHVFERSLHPELFEVRNAARVRQPRFIATIRIFDTGHWVEFRTRRDKLSEVVASREQPLPERFEILQRRINRDRDEKLKLASGLTYSTSFQFEQFSPERFLEVHEELASDCEKAPLRHSFAGKNRLAPSALSFLQTDVWSHSLLVHSFHTFPETCTLVKTQSLFEM